MLMLHHAKNYPNIMVMVAILVMWSRLLHACNVFVQDSRLYMYLALISEKIFLKIIRQEMAL